MHSLRSLLALLSLIIALMLVSGVLAGSGEEPTDPPLVFPTPVPEDAAWESLVCRVAVVESGPNQNLTPRSAVACEGGMAGEYPCQNVDLLSFVPSVDLNPPDVTGIDLNGNTVWGWYHPETGEEYALVGLRKGTAFVNVTQPESPEVVGFLRTAATGSPGREVVRDIKVYDNHAFITSETDPHGMQVVDLLRLPDVVPVAHYLGFTSAHNIVINEASGYAYVVGTTTCGQGLHIVDIRAPTAPRFAGCFGDEGYTHDAQCVIYTGPDSNYQGRELCFASQPVSDHLAILDVTDKEAISVIASVPYSGSRYTHQTWLSEDSRFLLLDDEFDETQYGVPTTTYLWDVSDLDAPHVMGTFVNGTTAIDHNLFIRGDRAFQSNYRSGLRVLDIADMGAVSEVGYFDIYPADDAPVYGGSWGNYPFLPSGNILVSGMEQGLYVLRPTGSAAAPDFDVEVRETALSICTGHAGQVTVDTRALYGYAGTLVLSVSGLPVGASATFAAPSLPAGAPTTLTVTLADTSPGTYYLTLAASAGDATREETFAVRVASTCERWLPLVDGP